MISIVKVYAKEKMVSYRRKQSVMIQRWKTMLPADKDAVVIIGYGSASFKSTGKGEIPVPTCRNLILLKRYLKVKYKNHVVVPIDEFRTTKRCCYCEHDLESVYDKVNKKTVRGLKLCSSEQCKVRTNQQSPVFLNRDLNAALNILRVLEEIVFNRERPKYLQRCDH